MKSRSYHLPAVHMSADDYVAVNFRLWQARPRTRFNHWLLAAAGLLLGVSVGLEVWEFGRPQTISTLVFLAVAVLYGLFRFALARYQLRRGYARQTAVQQPTDFTLTATEIIGRNALGQFSGPWKRIRRAVWAGPDWLLLYPSETACYYLDLRRLRPPATPADLAALLEHHRIPQQRQ
ncbi:hypothetical protein KLP40_14290 [Hymenobacter sp. NST-14]|uniref:hypothetical protein n=1 Tax=Hymenobacter piscis TaxID=2839984 RepID=UPI001C01D6BA|nr:hypothetical protein [Hymenobacter piscis]MBT9394336.1 hypothetical protein [Hymenobacter piscis]